MVHPADRADPGFLLSSKVRPGNPFKLLCCFYVPHEKQPCKLFNVLNFVVT